jgi:hypothetical protein
MFEVRSNPNALHFHLLAAGSSGGSGGSGGSSGSSGSGSVEKSSRRGAADGLPKLN